MILSENAQNVYKRLYYSSNHQENNPTQVHRRVAAFAATGGPFFRQGKVLSRDDDSLRREFFNLMENGEFRPNTPTLMNAGVVPFPQTSACFVGALADSLEAIFDFDRDAGFIYAQGSGLGGNYGLLREKDAALSTGGASSGPFAFMKKLAATAEAVKSGGRSRRAAHIAMMFDNHPDIEEFIELKNGQDKTFSSMNLSVAVSDAFMDAVRKDATWDLIGVKDGKVKKTISARGLFDKIVANAHKCGDPGLWFIGRANQDNTLKAMGRITSTNPCGEQALLPRQACGLGAINVSKFVKTVGVGEEGFDWAAFSKATASATVFLDACIDISGYPTQAYKDVAVATRPIGLGIMGFADALLLMGIPYAHKRARKFGHDLAKTLTRKAIETSMTIARSKGPFPLFESNKESVFEVVSRILMGEPGIELLMENLKTHGIRNSQWTTIAPTGSTSIACDCSQGMEPLFAVSYDKHLSDTGETWSFVHPLFKQWYEKEDWYESAVKLISENHGSCRGIDIIPTNVRDLWECAHDIDWKDRISMQAMLQDGISNSISSTINLPSDATPDTIASIYTIAWKSGCKGLTVYRDQSLDGQPVTFGAPADAKDATPADPAEMPVLLKRRIGMTHEMKTGHGKCYFTINLNTAGEPVEVFTNGAKNGSVNAANLEAIGRLVSLALQSGTPIEKVARTLENINDGTCVWERLDGDDPKDRPVQITSIPDALGKILRRFYCLSRAKPPAAMPGASVGQCGICGSELYMHDGCEFCPECGSKCG
ncbi:MAG: adenosylcobalamin-dependent ribonucleoside-diphosphate reductase [Desulfobacterales bacterium]|nr:adenosylcobalamin-dependent ribonucleoside-diphosphate reductase [Desulfobacterales bacterium]